MADYHLAILKKRYLKAIISGEKTVESRFTRTKRAPFGRISKGDLIFFKQTSRTVQAIAKVSEVRQFQNLNVRYIKNLERQYNQFIGADSKYWQSKQDSKYGVLIWLEDVKVIEPVTINKKDWRAWVVLSKENDYGLYTRLSI